MAAAAASAAGAGAGASAPRPHGSGSKRKRSPEGDKTRAVVSKDTTTSDIKSAEAVELCALVEHAKAELSAEDYSDDDAETLRARICALKARPIRDALVDWGLHKLRILTFVDKLTVSGYDSFELNSVFTFIKRLNLESGLLGYALELSLLLRLFVVLGGNINEVVYPIEHSPGVEMIGLSDYGRANKTTLIAGYINEPVVAVAVAMAGRRLGINWNVHHFYLGRASFGTFVSGPTAAAIACWALLRACASVGTINEHDACQRMVRIIGEAGMLFAPLRGNETGLVRLDVSGVDIGHACADWTTDFTAPEITLALSSDITRLDNFVTSLNLTRAMWQASAPKIVLDCMKFVLPRENTGFRRELYKVIMAYVMNFWDEYLENEGCETCEYCYLHSCPHYVV